MYALVDGNNFYVSCERVFRPELERIPMVVLSNNDGCIVSRSAEVKALNIPMGEPWFKIKDIAQLNGILAFSSNYELYGDMSARMHRVIGDFAPRQEIYSIDETFLDVTGMREDLTAMGQRIRYRTRQWVGIPVCVGIAPTKTLAKLANHIAKKRPEFDGVCNLGAMQSADVEGLMATLPVASVWGIGRQWNKRLKDMGVHNVLALRDCPPKPMRALGGVVLERMIAELKGIHPHVVYWRGWEVIYIPLVI